MGTIQIKKYERKVLVGKKNEQRQHVTRVGISFLANQSKKSLFKARAMRNDVSLSTKLYSELTGEEEGLTPNERHTLKERTPLLAARGVVTLAATTQVAATPEVTVITTTSCAGYGPITM